MEEQVFVLRFFFTSDALWKNPAGLRSYFSVLSSVCPHCNGA